MPRLLLLTDSLQNGGAERQLALLATHLPDVWEVRVWSMGAGVYEQVLGEAGVDVVLKPRRLRWDASPALDLWRLIRDWRPDVVHSWGWMSTAAAAVPCRRLKVPLIDGTIRHGRLPVKRGRTNRWAMRFADRVVANSRAGLEAYGVDAARGRVVYNGFDAARAATATPRAEDACTSVVMTGRMSREKDWAGFIGCARGLAEEGLWRFLAIGSGPDRAALVVAGRELVEDGTLRFVDGGTEVLGWVSRCDVGVLMTDPAFAAEGCSNAVLEYMAAGLPVVCTDSGGNRELVEDGLTGVVVPPKDVEAVVRALEGLQGDRRAAEAMGARGRARVLSEFSAERMVADTVAVYAEALTRVEGGAEWKV